MEPKKEVQAAASGDERYERSAKIAAQVEQKADDRKRSDQREQDDKDERKKKWEGGENRTNGELERPNNLLSSSTPSQRQLADAQKQPSIEQKHMAKDHEPQGHTQSQSQLDDRPGLGAQPSSQSESSNKDSEIDLQGWDQPKPTNLKPRTQPPTHVLLVEDNVVNQRVLKRHLQAKGFRVTTANNGQEAVDSHKRLLEDQARKDDREEKGENRATDTGQFQCILMDQEMVSREYCRRFELLTVRSP